MRKPAVYTYMLRRSTVGVFPDFMIHEAEGYAKSTGKVGVCLVTSLMTLLMLLLYTLELILNLLLLELVIHIEML